MCLLKFHRYVLGGDFLTQKIASIKKCSGALRAQAMRARGRASVGGHSVFKWENDVAE